MEVCANLINFKDTSYASYTLSNKPVSQEQLYLHMYII